MKKVFLFILLACVSFVHAEENEIKVGVHVGSKHINGKDFVYKKYEDFWGREKLRKVYAPNLNEENFGLYVKFPTKLKNVGYSFGFYDNSFNKTSVYAGFYYEKKVSDLIPVKVFDYLSFGGSVFAITGYENATGMPVLPAAAFEIKVGNERIAARVSYLPTSMGNANKVSFSNDVIGFSVEFGF